MHPLARKDSINVCQQPKLEREGTEIFLCALSRSIRSVVGQSSPSVSRTSVPPSARFSL